MSSPFGSSANQTPSSVMSPSMVKPLFSVGKTKDESAEDMVKSNTPSINNTDENDSKNGDNNAIVSSGNNEKLVTSTNTPLLDIPDTAAARKACEVFDELDANRSTTLPISDFEALLDELGEGFHGDEMDKQIKLVDPDNTNFIQRALFVVWYCNLVEEDEDANCTSSSLDTEEREEREEEMKKAETAFNEVSTNGGTTIDATKFGKLM